MARAVGPVGDLRHQHGDDRGVVEEGGGGCGRSDQARQRAAGPFPGTEGGPHHRLQCPRFLHSSSQDVQGSDGDGRRIAEADEGLTGSDDAGHEEDDDRAEDYGGRRQELAGQSRDGDDQYREREPGVPTHPRAPFSYPIMGGGGGYSKLRSAAMKPSRSSWRMICWAASSGSVSLVSTTTSATVGASYGSEIPVNSLMMPARALA